jgi:hypothetical protein
MATQWPLGISQPPLPRVVNYNSTVELTIGFELAPPEPGIGGWESMGRPDPGGDEIYLNAGVVYPDGLQDQLASLSFKELKPKIHSGGRFGLNFTPASVHGFTAFWFDGIAESVGVSTGWGPSFFYALSLFLRVSVDGSTTEFKYAAPAATQPPVARVIPKDAIFLIRS